jgi:hypothetical protein
MNYSKEVLEKELSKINKKLRELIKQEEKPCIIYAVKCLQKSNLALKQYLDSKGKNEKEYKRAEFWDVQRKRYELLAKKQDPIKYTNKRIELEIKIRDLNSKIYYMKG